MCDPDLSRAGLVGGVSIKECNVLTAFTTVLNWYNFKWNL